MSLRNEWRWIPFVAVFVGAALIAVLSLRGRTAWVDTLQFAALYPGLLVGGTLARAGIHVSFFVGVLASYLFWMTLVLLVALLLRRRARSRDLSLGKNA
jgi:hypothetical protein